MCQTMAMTLNAVWLIAGFYAGSSLVCAGPIPSSISSSGSDHRVNVHSPLHVVELGRNITLGTNLETLPYHPNYDHVHWQPSFSSVLTFTSDNPSLPTLSIKASNMSTIQSIQFPPKYQSQMVLGSVPPHPYQEAMHGADPRSNIQHCKVKPSPVLPSDPNAAAMLQWHCKRVRQ
jgi:hypothetical protein